MQNKHAYYAITVVLLSLAFHNPPIALGEHYIQPISELVMNSEGAEWKENNAERISLSHATPNAEVFYGELEGRLELAEKSKIKDSPSVRQAIPGLGLSANRRMVEVRLKPTPQNPHPSVRGEYVVNLPELKRIQLELLYDRVEKLDKSYGSEIEFSIEISERDAIGQWVSSAVLKPEQRIVDNPASLLFQIRDEQFSRHSSVLNLSKWSGKEIKIALVATASEGISKEVRGRWLKARLVGSTFDIQIGPE